MFAYLASLHEPLRHNAIEYSYGHYFTLMTCTCKKKKNLMP